MTRARQIAFAAVLVVAMIAAAGPAAAVVQPTPGPGARASSNTDLTLSAIGPGQGVNGFIANPDNPFDPVSAGYPTTNPGTDFTPRSEGFAGVITGTPTDASPPLKLYCIDILTNTYIGFGYQLGTWAEANVANVGYVAQLLNGFYPNTDEPATLTDLNQKAAAVQAAIWFFSDRYVLSTADPLHSAVAAITAKVIAEGPLVQPPPPSISISPSSLSGPQGTLVGPFTVTSSTTNTAQLTSLGADMFSDAGGTIPIAQGDPIASGNNVWLKASGAGAAVLQAQAHAVVPSGNVYLYDGNSGPNTAQRLILGQTAELTARAHADAVFQPPGNLTVNKSINGAAAGQQGPIVITATCNGAVLQPPLSIPANTPPGTVSQTYTNIPAGSSCTVVEVADGHLATVTARKAGSGIVVTIPAGGTATANLSDTFAVGSLIVNKTLSGDGAGQQGAVTIGVVCGVMVEPDFVIPAGTPSGTVSQEYTEIPAGTVCTATETANGATGAITVDVSGSPESVTIGPNGSGTVTMIDTYSLVPGSLVVTKSLTGSAAGQQGLIGILIDCGGGTVFAYVLPAGTPGGDQPRAFDGIPAGSTCTVVETINGSTSTVTVAAAGSGQQVAVPGGGSGAATLSNAVEPAQIPPPTPTTEPETMPATLPGTGGGSDAGGLVVLALTAGAAGAILLLLTRRRATR